MAELKCICGSDFRSPGEIKLAIVMGWSIEYAHLVLCTWEAGLDETLDKTHNMTDSEFYEYIEELKEEHGRTIKASTDQEGS